MAKLIEKKKGTAKETEDLMGLGQQLLDWVNERPRQVAAAAAGAAAAVLLVLGSLWLTGRAERNRIESVAAAVGRYSEGVGTEKGDATEELRRLAEKYSRFEEGGQARYFLAGSLAGQGDIQGAVAAYEGVIRDYSENTNLAGLARLGLAYAYRLAGDEEKALAAFLELQGDSATPLPQSQIALEIGLIYEALGKTAEALSAYKALVETFPESALSERAEKRIASLESV